MMNFLCSSESSRPDVDVQTVPQAEQEIKRHKKKEIDQKEQKEMKIETGRSYMWQAALWAQVQMSPEQFLFVNVLF